MDKIERVRAQSEAVRHLAERHGPRAEYEDLLLRYLGGALRESQHDGVNAAPDAAKADQDAHENHRIGHAAD